LQLNELGLVSNALLSYLNPNGGVEIWKLEKGYQSFRSAGLQAGDLNEKMNFFRHHIFVGGSRVSGSKIGL